MLLGRVLQDTAGQERFRTVGRRASYSVRVFPRAELLFVFCLTDLACALACIYNSVRRVKSRVFRGSPAPARGARELRRA